MRLSDLLMAAMAVGMAILVISTGFVTLWVILHYLCQGVYWSSRWLNEKAGR